MQRHLHNHHSSQLKSTAPVKKTLKGQTTLTNAFASQLSQSSVRATAITRDISVFIAADMRPFSVVENLGFRRLLHKLEPKYTIPSHAHFTRTVVPNLYKESKAKVLQTLKEAESIAITTDGWTSRVPTHGREGALGAEAEVTEPASKKTALEDLLGDSFSTEPEQSNRGIEREIELYRREASIPLSSCPLKWWRENCSLLAKAYLSIPATSVPSERVFSTAGDIVTAQRSQLLRENIDMLIFLKKNMTIS
ncbi:ZBED4 protein, partial [Amia calva]|nr:ZBED4 protein [Amia calva]